MHYPEAKLQTVEAFRGWWSGLGREPAGAEHEVLDLDVHRKEHHFEVDLRVEWRRPGHNPQRYHQRWWVRDQEGWPVIQRLEVEPLD